MSHWSAKRVAEQELSAKYDASGPSSNPHHIQRRLLDDEARLVNVQEAEDQILLISSVNANPLSMSMSSPGGLQQNNEHVAVPPPTHL